MVEGPDGVLNVCPSWNRPLYEPSKRRITWPHGAVAIAYAAESPELLRGPQHDGAWCDELAKWKNLRKKGPEGGTAFSNLMFGLRVGINPQCVIGTTPRPVPTLQDLLKRSTTHVTKGSSYENRDNLSPAWFQEIIGQYEGTRLGRQELHADLLLDVPGALWTRDIIEADRVQETPELRRIVVAIDPATTDKESSAETGIIAAGVSGVRAAAHGYALEDASGRYSPDGWARQAIAMYHRLKADRIVAEANQGGDMVKYTLATIDRGVPVTLVHASRGKRTRAEPVAALYEQHRVHHVGMLAQLEDQMCTWDQSIGEASPDRVDALVWALTDLMVDQNQGGGYQRVSYHH